MSSLTTTETFQHDPKSTVFVDERMEVSMEFFAEMMGSLAAVSIAMKRTMTMKNIPLPKPESAWTRSGS